MSLENFQFLDNIAFDESIVLRDFLRIYHQQGVQLKNTNQNINIIFGENNISHQIGNVHHEHDISVRSPAGNFSDASYIRLMNNAFAYCFKEAILSTTGGSEL